MHVAHVIDSKYIALNEHTSGRKHEVGTLGKNLFHPNDGGQRFFLVYGCFTPLSFAALLTVICDSPFSGD
jgi:hypothetical protein